MAAAATRCHDWADDLGQRNRGSPSARDRPVRAPRPSPLRASPLRRYPDRGLLGGVCAGLAERLGVDVRSCGCSLTALVAARRPRRRRLRDRLGADPGRARERGCAAPAGSVARAGADRDRPRSRPRSRCARPACAWPTRSFGRSCSAPAGWRSCGARSWRPAADSGARTAPVGAPRCCAARARSTGRGSWSERCSSASPPPALLHAVGRAAQPRQGDRRGGDRRDHHRPAVRAVGSCGSHAASPRSARRGSASRSARSWPPTCTTRCCRRWP